MRLDNLSHRRAASCRCEDG